MRTASGYGGKDFIKAHYPAANNLFKSAASSLSDVVFGGVSLLVGSSASCFQAASDFAALTPA